MKHLQRFPIFVFLTVLLSFGCREIKFAVIKEAPVGSRFTVKGYFANDPLPILVKDPAILKTNTPMSKNDYILLKGVKIDSLRSADSKSYGARLTVTGTLEKGNNPQMDENVFFVNSIDENNPASNAGVNPPILNLCTLDPSLCPTNLPPADPKKFALLYSGGAAPSDARNRYWNDLVFMYLTLKSQYGYSDANIVVVYKDGPNGPGQTTEMNVDFPATAVGLDQAIADLQVRMSQSLSTPTLFVFTTNHGGGYRSLVNKVKGGAIDTAPYDEPTGETIHMDETLFFYGTGNEYIRDEDWAIKINSLVNVNGNHRQLVTVNEPCFSGGLLNDLKGPNRVNISAASEFEYSYSRADGKFDEFSYHFTAALHKRYPLNGTIVNANRDTDPRISILEAYLFAADKDLTPSSSYLDDNQNGQGTPNPPIPSSSSTSSTADGVLASTIHL